MLASRGSRCVVVVPLHVQVLLGSMSVWRGHSSQEATALVGPYPDTVPHLPPRRSFVPQQPPAHNPLLSPLSQLRANNHWQTADSISELKN